MIRFFEPRYLVSQAVYAAMPVSAAAQSIALKLTEARDARLRGAVRAVLLGSQLETATFGEALTGVRQMPQFELLFRSP